MRKELQILRDQGNVEGARGQQDAIDSVPVSQEIRDDPHGYLDRLQHQADGLEPGVQELATDRQNALNLVEMRRELEILHGRGDIEGARRMEEAIDRVPVSQEIRDDPQGHLDRFAEAALAASAEPTPGDARAEGADVVTEADEGTTPSPIPPVTQPSWPASAPALGVPPGRPPRSPGAPRSSVSGSSARAPSPGHGADRAREREADAPAEGPDAAAERPNALRARAEALAEFVAEFVAENGLEDVIDRWLRAESSRTSEFAGAGKALYELGKQVLENREIVKENPGYAVDQARTVLKQGLAEIAQEYRRPVEAAADAVVRGIGAVSRWLDEDVGPRVRAAMIGMMETQAPPHFDPLAEARLAHGEGPPERAELRSELFEKSHGYVYQLHVEGPATSAAHTLDGKSTLWADPDAIRSESYWSPVHELLEHERTATPSGKTWGDLAEELHFPEELRNLYDEGVSVKDWSTIAAEKALDPKWGARTCVSVAHIPDNVEPKIKPVDPLPGAPAAGGGGTEVIFDDREPFGVAWKVVDGAEVPELAEKLLDEAPRDPLERTLYLADKLSNPEDPRHRY